MVIVVHSVMLANRASLSLKINVTERKYDHS